MAKTDDDVRNLLTREAEKAGELHVDVRDLEHRVGARRNMGSVLAVAAVVAVVAGVAAGVSLTRLRSGSSGTTAAQGGFTSSTSAHAAGHGSVAQTSVHPLACGAALTPPLMKTGPHGARLAVVSVSTSAATHTAMVTIKLTVTSPAQLSVQGLTPVQILLLRGDQVADRLATYSFRRGEPQVNWLAREAAEQRGGQSAVARVLTLAPTAPFTLHVTGPRLCQGADWTAAARGTSGYKVVAVMSVPHSAAQPTSVTNDPLLISSPHSATR